MDNSLADANLTTNNILNFLYTGPEEWREPGMPAFDWRNVFNVADQLLRMFNQYGEVRNITEGRLPDIPRMQCRGSLLWPLLAPQTGASVLQVCILEVATRPLFETEQTT